MNSEIIGLTDWLATPAGRYLLDWEQARFDEAVGDLFGYHALQLGLPALDGLRTNRMPHQWLALPDLLASDANASPTDPGATGSTGPLPIGSRRAALFTDSAALPFRESSLDLVLLPHTLELSPDPHATLREALRVLVPEGRVVISGFNPASLWGLRQRRGAVYERMGYGDRRFVVPPARNFIGHWRLRDWLRLLDFEVESGRFGCYRPAMQSQKWLDRFDWMDRAGARWWPIFGAVYFVVAVKRVRGMRLLGPAWKTHKATSAAPAVVAGRSGQHKLPMPPRR